MDGVGARDHHLRGFAFAGVHVDGGFPGRAAFVRSALVENVDHVVVRFIELGLREVRKQALVAAVAVDDDHFLAAVASHLVGGFLQQGELHPAAVSHGSGLVTGFGNLAKIYSGKTIAYSFSAACSAA